MNRPAKLLYIEDDELDRLALLRLVGDKGLLWEVKLAETLGAARACLAESRFDVIVADYHLPDGDCTELFDEVLDTPFVLITGTLEEQLALRTLERGADDYLPKDTDQRHLEALPFTVEKTLYRKHIRETEQRLKRELRESEARFTAFMNHLPGAAWIKDLHGRYVYANPEAERIFATPLHVLKGKTDEDIFPPETARQFRENDRRVLTEGGCLQTTEALRQADGREHPSLVSKFVVSGPDGRAEYVGGVAFDITERQQAEEALRDSEERFRAVFDNAAVGIAIGSADGRCLHANKAACDFIGRSAEEVVGLRIDDIVYPDDRYLTSSLVPRLIAGDIPFYTVERRYVHKTKGIVWGWASVSLVRDSAGRPKNLIGVMTDITERKEAERARREVVVELARSNEELEQFAYVASHDLQEPLRQVTGYMHLLKERYGSKLDASAEEFIGFAVDGATRMSQLISDLLAYARVGTRGGELRATDVNDVVTGVLDRLRSAIEDHHAVVTHDPLPTVRGDASQLRQLFQNLLGNAIKFHGQELPRIHVGVRSAGATWELSVSDNGIGMDAQHYDRIFMMFQRLHTREQYPGTGIGLAICKKIVERHGGRIWVESKPQKGSTFYFTLPRAGDASDRTA